MTPLTLTIGDALALILAQATALWATVDVCRLMTTAADSNLLQEMRRMTDSSSYIANARPLSMGQPPAVPSPTENSSVYSDDGRFRTHVFPAATPSEHENGSISSRHAEENLHVHHNAPEDVLDVPHDAEADPTPERRAGPGRAASSAPSTVQQAGRQNAISVTLTSVTSPTVESEMTPINEVRIVVGQLQNSITVRTSSAQINVDMPN